MKVDIKNKIENFIQEGLLDEANSLIDALEEKIGKDNDIFSLRSCVEFSKGNFSEAVKIAEGGLKSDSFSAELLYNAGLASVYNNSISKGYSLLSHAREVSNDPVVKKLCKEVLDLVSSEMKDRKKLVFFYKQNMGHFLDSIIEKLYDEFDIRKVAVDDLRSIDDYMKWSDIAWFEWCDELAIYGSKLKIAEKKKVICRLHSYEAYTDIPKNLEMKNVDKIIFVADHVRDIVSAECDLKLERSEVIYNGIDLNDFKMCQKSKGYNIAYLGYLNFKKNPVLLLHTFKKIFDYDNNYKLFIAGKFQNSMYEYYYTHMIKELGLEENVFLDGWQENVDKWLEDKNYLLSTSLKEGNPVGVMEAMAKGIRPLIHNFPGAKEQFGKYVWSSIDGCLSMITDDEYDSNEYRKFILDNYSIDLQVSEILRVLKDLSRNIEEFEEEFDCIDLDSGIMAYLDGKTFSNGLKFDVRNTELKDRVSFLTEVAMEKKIIHLGCADHMGIIDMKMKNNSWLHGEMSKVAAKVIGVDNNKEAIEYLKTKHRINNVLYGDIVDEEFAKVISVEKWDYLVMGEILEHVDNPVDFLKEIKKRYKGIVKNIVITVPNALRYENFYFSENNIECINSDHRYWFTPYTLLHVMRKAGFVNLKYSTCQGIIQNNNLNILKDKPLFRDTVIGIGEL